MEATAFARVFGHRLHVRSFWNSSTHPKFTFWDPRRGAMARQRKEHSLTLSVLGLDRENRKERHAEGFHCGTRLWRD